MKLLSTKEAAGVLGITVQRVHALIKESRLPAQKIGRDYIIDASNLKLVEDRKPGRPPKTEAAKGKDVLGRKRSKSK